jgi:hypothetical protein
LKKHHWEHLLLVLDKSPKLIQWHFLISLACSFGLMLSFEETPMMRDPHDTHGTNIWVGPGIDVDVKNDAELGRVGETQAGVHKNMAGLGESSSRGIIC